MRLEVNAATFPAFPESGIYAACAASAENSPTTVHNAGREIYANILLNGVIPESLVKDFTGVSSR